jgi:hypothetical protein
MIKRFCNWYLSTFHPGDDVYWKARWEGHKAEEDMVFERIAEHYPDKFDEMRDNLLR